MCDKTLVATELKRSRLVDLNESKTQVPRVRRLQSSVANDAPQQ
jgi:hypothetical protein